MRKASKRAFLNIRITLDTRCGKGVRSLKCCDRGITRKSLPGGNKGRRMIHGKGGRTFGSAITVLGTSSTLVSTEKKRRKMGKESHPEARGRSHCRIQIQKAHSGFTPGR